MGAGEKSPNKCFNKLLMDCDRQPRISRVIHDPIGKTEVYLSVEKDLEKKLQSYFDDKCGWWASISCFEYWSMMKHTLREDYQIEWKSPVELNPSVFGENEVAF